MWLVTISIALFTMASTHWITTMIVGIKVSYSLDMIEEAKSTGGMTILSVSELENEWKSLRGFLGLISTFINICVFLSFLCGIIAIKIIGQ